MSLVAIITPPHTHTVCTHGASILRRYGYVFTKGFEQCVREETAHLAILNLRVFKLITFLKRLHKLEQETADIETGMAEKSHWDQANRRQKLGLVCRNRKKIAYFTA